MIKNKDQRVGVFVDVSNMYHSAKNLYGARVNFKEVLKEVLAGRILIRAVAYVVKSGASEEEQFFEALDKSGFEVKYKELQVFSTGMKKADWDVGLAVDAIKMADKLDSVVLVSGDGDYVPLVIYLRENKGCLVEAAAFKETTSSKLIEVLDDYLDLSSDKDKFLIRAGGHGVKETKRRARQIG